VSTGIQELDALKQEYLSQLRGVFPLHRAALLLVALVVVALSKDRGLPGVSMKFIGLIHMDNVRSIIFNPDHHPNIKVKDLMGKPAAIINLNENLHNVLKKFDDTNQWNLPVVDDNKYVGFVSKSSVLTRYRSELLKSI
jgi:CIC family chloride channel protein